MPNSQPIFTRIADVQWSTSNVITSNNTNDLTSGTIYQVFSADTTNGGYVQKIRFKPSVVSANTATVARIWINNGDSTTGSSNNILFDEVSLASTTLSSTSSLPVYELPLNFALPPSYRLFVTLGATVIGGYQVTVIGGKY
jgi:hypothetical protein